MKKLNLSAVIAAYRELKKAESHVDFYANRTNVNEKWLAEAREKLAAARNEFTTAAEPLKNAIREAEGRATARTVTPEKILDTIAEIEGKLNLPKNAMKGVKIFGADPNAQKFPAAYNYTPESTKFSLEHNGKTWFLTAIERCTCSANRGGIQLTDAAKTKLIENASRL